MKLSRISNEAVLKATGKDWKQWFSILDNAGAKNMKHTDIARWLYGRYFGGPDAKGRGKGSFARRGWWSQMVTVEYERAKGLRSVNEQANGFLVSAHKTVPGSAATLQKKWIEILKLPIVAKMKLGRIPSKTQRAILRYKARVGGVVVSFDGRGKGKARIMVEAVKLPKKADVEPARKFWKKILNENIPA